ncbi:MAG: hypothetical protein AAFY56_12475 [Pseudomonadota bacterium]
MLIVALVFGWAINHSLCAQEIQLGSVTFAAEHGGIQLIEASGEGSRTDPFVVVEEITDASRAILTIRNLASNFGNTRYVHSGMGFVLVKIVRNMTDEPWYGFEFELRERLDRVSDLHDGLSFGQATGEHRFFESSRYTTIDTRLEPLDVIRFSGDAVLPGEAVAFRVSVTDYSPQAEFFLLQRRDSPLSNDRPFRWMTCAACD